MNIHYDMIGAYFEGIRMHPQEVVKELGVTYRESESFMLSDSWVFYDCELINDVLPSFMSRLKD